MKQFFIGIDVSKDSFNYCIINSKLKEVLTGEYQMIRNDFESFKALIQQYPESVIALESTGSYHTNILSFLISFKKEVCLVNPVLIKKFASSITLRKTKTDEIDANLIAKFICKNAEHLSYFSIEQFDEIIAIARIREDLSKQVARAKTQLKQHVNVVFPELMVNYNIFTDTILAILEKYPTTEIISRTSEKKIQSVINNIPGRKSNITAKIIKELAKQSIGKSSIKYQVIIQHEVEMLKFLMSKLNKLTDTFIDEIKKSKKDDLEILSSIKGISDISASHFMAEIKNIDRFETKGSLIAFTGTDPSVKQSGKSLHRNGRISKKGSSSLRRYVYLMASGVMKFNEYFRAYYLKKRAQGMQHRKAMIALCNKLLRTIFALLKKGEKFVMPTHYL